MNAREFIEAAGGTKTVMTITGLSRASMCNWRQQNYIPAHWVKYFRLINPIIRKATLNLAADYPKKPKKTTSEVQILNRY